MDIELVAQIVWSVVLQDIKQAMLVFLIKLLIMQALLLLKCPSHLLPIDYISACCCSEME